MSVAVFSADPVLSRMLELEAKRCELSLSSPEQAEVWLIDLDSPVPLPGKGKAAFCALLFHSSDILWKKSQFRALLFCI